MYLKSLELHGFKSFPNRTVLSFERGATVVIGPNGSGKSNISDAMRWVLGEMSSKNIRGTKMEDVIFGGADTRRPMSFAEVTVTFDNSDTMHRIDSPYEEISVTRRYYRSGDSEYFLNRKQCRLRDIHELFMNTGIGRDGYSIIGQGKISEILSKKSEDRRNIFEEAAGIAKYRYRKNDSERKLAETEANMLRLSDVIAELEARVGPLERDAEKARKYLELYEEKKRADVSVWLYDTENMNSEEEAAAKALAVSSHELEMAEDTVKGLERQYDKLFEDAQKTKLESERLLGEIREKDGLIARLDSEYKLSENETEHTLALISLADKSKEDGLAALKKTEDEIADAAKNADIARAEAQLLEGEYGQLAEKQRLADERIAALNAEIGELLADIAALEKTQNEGAVRLGVLEGGLATDKDTEIATSEEIKNREEEALRYEKNAENAEKTLKRYEERVEKCAADVAELERQRALLGEKERKLSTEALGAAASRDAQNERADALEKMEEHFEGYSNAVRTVMQDYASGKLKTSGKIYGPLSKLISAKPEHSIAIETALAANIQNIAVDTEETARDAIYYLKNNNGGRATFCPVSSVTPQEETYEQTQAQKCAGCIGRADELVDCDPIYRDIVSRFLARTLVFTDLESATEAAKGQKYRIKAVTLDGQVVNPGGSFTGGSVRGGGNGILSRPAQIEKLRKGAAAEDERYRKLDAEAEKTVEDMTAVEKSAAKLREDREMMLALAGAERSSMEAAKAKAESARGIIAKLRLDLARMSDLRVSAAAEAERIREEGKKLQAEIDRISGLRAEKYTALTAEQDEKEALREKESATLIALAEKRKDGENISLTRLSLDRRADELEKELELGEARRADYLKTLAELEEGRRLNRQNAESVMKMREALAESRSTLEADGTEFEKKQNELYRRIKDKNAEKELLFRTHTKNEEKARRLTELRDRLTEQLAEEYQLTYSQAVALGYPKLTEETKPETVSQQKKLKNQMKALGNVNVSAIEEFAQVKARYDELTTQYKDLMESRTKLADFIASVEGEMKRRFIDTFERVNGFFGEVFSQLFGGGHAELLLTDPENILESGIDIKAAPPGKIVKSLSLLSGGEQSFVAIALLFAVLKVNPSPFCIFDEIESALDEVNVARFAEYIKNFSEETQFILITHRRGTMEAADRMYGVTMPEQGVSKVISLNVGDFDNKNGEFSDGIS
ncbi:MAG: chromosome segregation protein SMC [Clostridia bacterium]|nr:chromosome segregation protein SMC [Clostridia bacterium]